MTSSLVSTTCAMLQPDVLYNFNFGELLYKHPQLWIKFLIREEKYVRTIETTRV